MTIDWGRISGGTELLSKMGTQDMGRVTVDGEVDEPTSETAAWIEGGDRCNGGVESSSLETTSMTLMGAATTSSLEET